MDWNHPAKPLTLFTMRCLGGFASLLCVVVAAPHSAMAQPASAELTDTAEVGDGNTSTAPVQSIGYGALPGGLYVATAETLAKGVVQVANLDGYGYRSGLLGPGTSFTRTSGDIAAAFGLTDFLTLGLSLDGRYDKHKDPSDNGYVGDPHLLIRAAKSSSGVHYGGQIGIWVPGKNAPSIAASAISIDFRGLVSIPAGPALLSFEGGFLLDNSINSVDDATQLSLQDRVSLGVSDYNSLYGGVQLAIPINKLWIGLEASLNAFVGSIKTAGDAPLSDGTLTIRGGAIIGYHITNEWAALAFVEAAKVPTILLTQVMDASIPLLPYEPSVTGGIGIQARFGGPKRTGSAFVEKDCHRHTPPDCPAVKVPLLADITGTVVDTTDKPLVGAKVSLTLKNSSVPTVASDDKGNYVFKGVPIGNMIDNKPVLEEIGVEVNVVLDGKKPGKATIAAVAQGTNAVPPIKLESVLPPGQLRGVVRALPAGKAVAGATVTVTPGDQKAETGADGTFSVDLAPGQYKIVVNAKGLQQQELDVTIDPNGVAIKNIDLHK